MEARTQNSYWIAVGCSEVVVDLYALYEITMICWYEMKYKKTCVKVKTIFGNPCACTVHKAIDIIRYSDPRMFFI